MPRSYPIWFELNIVDRTRDAVQKAISFELEKQNLRLNGAEKAYIADKPKVTIGLVKGYSFYGYEKNYTKHGIIPSFFDKISFLTDLQFEYVFDSYDKLMQNDKIDLIPAVGSGDNEAIYSNYMFSRVVNLKTFEDSYFEEGAG